MNPTRLAWRKLVKILRDEKFYLVGVGLFSVIVVTYFGLQAGFFLTLLLAWIVFNLDTAPILITTTILVTLIPLSLILEDELIAQELANYVYFLLVFTVAIETSKHFRINLFFRKLHFDIQNIKSKTKYTPIHNLNKTLDKETREKLASDTPTPEETKPVIEILPSISNQSETKAYKKFDSGLKFVVNDNSQEAKQTTPFNPDSIEFKTTNNTKDNISENQNDTPSITPIPQNETQQTFKEFQPVTPNPQEIEIERDKTSFEPALSEKIDHKKTTSENKPKTLNPETNPSWYFELGMAVSLIFLNFIFFNFQGSAAFENAIITPDRYNLSSTNIFLKTFIDLFFAFSQDLGFDYVGGFGLLIQLIFLTGFIGAYFSLLRFQALSQLWQTKYPSQAKLWITLISGIYTYNSFTLDQIKTANLQMLISHFLFLVTIIYIFNTFINHKLTITRKYISLFYSQSLILILGLLTPGLGITSIILSIFIVIASIGIDQINFKHPTSSDFYKNENTLQTPLNSTLKILKTLSLIILTFVFLNANSLLKTDIKEFNEYKSFFTQNSEQTNNLNSVLLGQHSKLIAESDINTQLDILKPISYEHQPIIASLVIITVGIMIIFSSLVVVKSKNYQRIVMILCFSAFIFTGLMYLSLNLPTFGDYNFWLNIEPILPGFAIFPALASATVLILSTATLKQYYKIRKALALILLIIGISGLLPFALILETQNTINNFEILTRVERDCKEETILYLPYQEYTTTSLTRYDKKAILNPGKLINKNECNLLIAKDILISQEGLQYADSWVPTIDSILNSYTNAENPDISEFITDLKNRNIEILIIDLHFENNAYLKSLNTDLQTTPELEFINQKNIWVYYL